MPAEDRLAFVLFCFFKLFFKISLFYFLIFCCVGSSLLVWAFSSCCERGLLFVVVRGLLIAVASLCFGAGALGAQASVAVSQGLSSCGSWALEHKLSSYDARA